jgi:hypothetical protein
VCSSPVLKLPNLKEHFILRTNASDRGLGAILLQEEGGVLWPVDYASRKRLPREVNYSVIEKESLAIVWGVLKFGPYLYGREFILQSGPSNKRGFPCTLYTVHSSVAGC